MTNTIREQIIQAFTARAQSLSNLPVERVLRSVNDTTERFVTVWDGEDNAIESGYTLQKNQLSIELICIFNAGDENASVVANATMGEIIKTIHTGSQTFNNLAIALNYQSTQIEYPKDGSDYTTVIVTFNIIYSHKKGDPFTAAP